jgi:hypothetical protein
MLLSSDRYELHFKKIQNLYLERCEDQYSHLVTKKIGSGVFLITNLIYSVQLTDEVNDPMQGKAHIEGKNYSSRFSKPKKDVAGTTAKWRMLDYRHVGSLGWL